eukprot:7216225-Pyramimonas_sp.AAC.1
MMCEVSFGKNGPAFIKWKTHPLAKKFLTRVVELPETWRRLGGYIPQKTYVEWARMERTVKPRHWREPVPRPINLRHFVPAPQPD